MLGTASAIAASAASQVAAGHGASRQGRSEGWGASDDEFSSADSGMNSEMQVATCEAPDRRDAYSYVIDSIPIQET